MYFIKCRVYSAKANQKVAKYVVSDTTDGESDMILTEADIVSALSNGNQIFGVLNGSIYTAKELLVVAAANKLNMTGYLTDNNEVCFVISTQLEVDTLNTVFPKVKNLGNYRYSVSCNNTKNVLALIKLFN